MKSLRESIFDPDLVEKDIDFLSILSDRLQKTLVKLGPGYWKEREKGGWDHLIDEIRQMSVGKKEKVFHTITEMLSVKRNVCWVAFVPNTSNGLKMILLYKTDSSSRDLPTVIELGYDGCFQVYTLQSGVMDYSFYVSSYVRMHLRWNKFDTSSSGVNAFQRLIGWWLE